MQQKVLPLNKPLDKLGEARIEGDKRFDVSDVRVGGQAEAHVTQRDFFAAGSTRTCPTQKSSRAIPTS